MMCPQNGADSFGTPYNKETTQMTKTGDILGDARVSTSEQNTSPQSERLKDAGALRVFEGVISGKQSGQP